MRRKFYYLAFLLLSMACMKENQIVDNQHSTHGALHDVTIKNLESSNALMLMEDQQRLANISVTKISSNNHQQRITTYGIIKPFEGNVSSISSQVSGRIEKLYVKDVGEKIVVGQKLYSLYSEELITMQHEFLGAQPGTSLYENTKRKLVQKGLSPRVINEIENTQKVVSSLDFFARVSGYVEKLLVKEGQYVAENDQVFVLQNSDKVWVEAIVYPSEVQTISVKDSIIVSGAELKPVTEKILAIDPRIDENDRGIRVRSLLKNYEGTFISGAKVQVSIKSNSKVHLTIPASAVLYHGNEAIIFVKLDDFSFMPRKISTGKEIGGIIEVLKGVEENEQIVISGAFLLLSEWILKFGEDSIFAL